MPRGEITQPHADITDRHFPGVFQGTYDPEKPTFVALPTEDPEYQSKCGLLLKHIYGTQVAADRWQQEYSQTLIDLEFKQGAASPCVFHERGHWYAASMVMTSPLQVPNQMWIGLRKNWKRDTNYARVGGLALASMMTRKAECSTES